MSNDLGRGGRAAVFAIWISMAIALLSDFVLAYVVVPIVYLGVNSIDEFLNVAGDKAWGDFTLVILVWLLGATIAWCVAHVFARYYSRFAPGLRSMVVAAMAVFGAAAAGLIISRLQGILMSHRAFGLGGQGGYPNDGVWETWNSIHVSALGIMAASTIALGLVTWVIGTRRSPASSPPLPGRRT